MSRDSWEGDAFSPQTLNGWGYVAGNPVNNIDPSGEVTWRQASTYEHKAIEIFYENKYGDYQVHREYGQVPGFKTWIDLIYFPAVTQGRFRNNFNFGPTLGEVYEIEPIDEWDNPKGGLNEVTKFIGLLKQNKEKLWGKGKVKDRSYIYHGWDYDWRRVEWGVGDSFDLTGLEVHKVWVPEQNNKMILVWLQRPGLIVYLDPKDDDHKQKLVTNPEFSNIRFRVVAKASNEFQEYAEQLRNSATACYVDLPEEYWDPNYRPKTWLQLIDEFLTRFYRPITKYHQKCAEFGMNECGR